MMLHASTLRAVHSIRRIAVFSLVHDRGKFLGALCGVSFAAMLVLVQSGLYQGFQQTSSEVIRRAGGDLWVMVRGTPVVDSGEVMSVAARYFIEGHPCIGRTRGLVQSFATIRKAAGTEDSVVLVGYEPDPVQVLPWNLLRGLPGHLHGPSRVAVDELDLDKLQIHGDPLKASLEVGGQTVYVVGLTRGIRSFTLSPYMFTEIHTARRLLGLARDQAHFWLVDLRHPACREDVTRWIHRHPELLARTPEEFSRITESYWVGGSGAGTALGFSAVLGLIVGLVIVGQTLYSMTKDHRRELATLKAMGAKRWELAGFVFWQTALLAGAGGATGALLALGARAGLSGMGLLVVLSESVFLFGLGAILLMCFLASVSSVRVIFALEAAEVFK